MNTIKLSVGEAIVKFLDNQYISFDGVETKFVDGVFTIYGHGCVLGVGEALAMADHNIKVYQGKNEQGMAHVALSYAKQNNRRKIMPCVSSIGPGSANMITAAATATVNNVPLLLLCGDSFATRQPDPVLQQIEQLDSAITTTNDAYKAVTKYFDRITRPEITMTAMLNAMRVLTDPATTGAVCIALPQDVQGEIYDFPTSFIAKRVHRITRPCAVAEEIQDAVNSIKNSKTPLFIVGGGARYSEAGSLIEEMSSKLNIPFAETQAGKSTCLASHPLNLGGLGVTGNSQANDIASQADLIIGIGTRYSDFTTASKSLYAEKQVISINISNYHASKLDGIKIVGDAKSTLQCLYNELLKIKYRSSYTTQIEQAKENWSKEYKRLTSIEYNDQYVSEVSDMTDNTVKDYIKANGGYVCQTTALGIIREIVPKDSIVVGAAGSLPGCLQRMWTTDSRYSYNMEYGYSCMGYEIAGALGSKLADENKPVYALTGDGSYLMLHSELVTAIQENKKITVLLFDNSGFGCINNLQMGQGIVGQATEFRQRDKNGNISTGEFMNIDFAMCAKGYGLVTYTVKNHQELKEALIDALKQTKSVLIDIKTLPKSMTHGYGGWWNIGVTNNPRTVKQKQALQEKIDMQNKAKKY